MTYSVILCFTMAEDIRKIIAVHKFLEEQKGKADPTKLKALETLGSTVDLAEQLGALQARMPSQSQVQTENVAFPTEEQLSAIERFSPEARTVLENAGYSIYGLTGQSIKTLREAGRKFWSTWHKGHDFENLASRLSEVAIHPDPEQFYLPNSNKKTLSQQEELVGRFSEQLRTDKEIKGVEAIIGGVADYTELAFAHLDRTRERLFGEKYGYRYTRTNTPTVGSGVAIVGDFDARFGLYVSDWSRDDGDPRVWVSPLVVPAGNK